MIKLYLAAFVVFFVTVPAVGLQITSEAFDPSDYLPSRNTCDGNNYSPPLSFTDVPPNTRSLVLICDDPDAPFKTWVHWVVVNIPPDIDGFAENISQARLGELGITQGKNDYGKAVYSGPCPPAGWPHRYFFKLYALDKRLSLKEGFRKADVIDAMQGHIIAEATVIGLYRRLRDNTPNY